MPSPPPKDHPWRLLVEGRDDVMAIGALLQRRGLTWPETTWSPRITDHGGIDALLHQLPVALKASYRRLGVVVAADDDLQKRWGQLRGRFQLVGLGLPQQPAAKGTILVGAGSIERVGLWVMPDNRLAGQLEDFLSLLVPREDALWQHARLATRNARTDHGAKLGEPDQCKGELHCYLAWQERPGMPLGTAITAKILEDTGLAVDAFVDWIHQTFAD